MSRSYNYATLNTSWNYGVIENYESFNVPPLSKTAYFINLDDDVHRKDHMNSILPKLGFENIIRVKPFESDTARKSLTTTHKHILEDIANKTKEEFYFIFEDDIEVNSDKLKYNEVFGYIEQELRDNLHNKTELLKGPMLFVYLGVCVFEYEDSSDWNNICKEGVCSAERMLCTHAYMITPKGAKYLAERIFPHARVPIDDQYRKILQKENVVIIGKELCNDKYEGHCGIFFQDREADWYDGSRIT